jgi:hypothetical protein
MQWPETERNGRGFVLAASSQRIVVLEKKKKKVDRICGTHGWKEKCKYNVCRQS